MRQATRRPLVLLSPVTPSRGSPAQRDHHAGGSQPPVEDGVRGRLPRTAPLRRRADRPHRQPGDRARGRRRRQPARTRVARLGTAAIARSDPRPAIEPVDRQHDDPAVSYGSASRSASRSTPSGTTRVRPAAAGMASPSRSRSTSERQTICPREPMNARVAAARTAISGTRRPSTRT